MILINDILDAVVFRNLHKMVLINDIVLVIFRSLQKKVSFDAIHRLLLQKSVQMVFN